MKKASKIARAKRTRLGRILCRLAGDEAGAVMMEYVVLALLVCAAVVGIVMVFGDSISAMFTATTQTLGGKDSSGVAAKTRGEQIKAQEEHLTTERKNSEAIIYGGGDTNSGAGAGGE